MARYFVLFLLLGGSIRAEHAARVGSGARYVNDTPRAQSNIELVAETFGVSPELAAGLLSHPKDIAGNGRTAVTRDAHVQLGAKMPARELAILQYLAHFDEKQWPKVVSNIGAAKQKLQALPKHQSYLKEITEEMERVAKVLGTLFSVDDSTDLTTNQEQRLNAALYFRVLLAYREEYRADPSYTWAMGRTHILKEER